MKARSLLSVFVVTMALPTAASAAITTVGGIVEAPGSTALDCSSGGGFPPGAMIGQATGDSVPSSGVVTSWSINATGDGSGAETLYVLAPNGSGYTVLSADTEAIPSTIPAGGTVTYNLATPVAVATGDTFGLAGTGAGPVNCAWEGPAYASDSVFLALGSGGVGQTITPMTTAPGASLDLAVTIAPGNNDVAVSTTAGPSNALVNNEALLSSSVTNKGPFAGMVTFSDTVPAGLAIDAVAAAGGSCSVAGQVVTCTFASLAVGASAPVEVVVTPVAAQSYQNTVSVADGGGATDPNNSDNSATATLTVATAPVAPAATVTAARACVATNLKGLSEKVVRRLLPALGCKVGKIKKARSKKVAKGDVISLSPGSGSHPAGTAVTLTVSSGKPKKKHKG